MKKIKIRRFLRKLIYMIPYFQNQIKTEFPKDIQVCEIFQNKVRFIKNGYKIICNLGIGSIFNVDDTNNIKGLNIDCAKRKSLRRIDSLKQYYVKFKDPITGKFKTYPLSFADYKYMDSSMQIDHAKVFITNKKFAKLTKDEIEKRDYISHFNTNSRGKEILRKLREEGYIIIRRSEYILKSKHHESRN